MLTTESSSENSKFNKSSEFRKARKKRIMKILIIILVILSIWLMWGNFTLGVSYYKIKDSKLPASFDGFKIAHISDFHNSNFGNSLVKKLQKEKPDIICITGDFVDCNRLDMDVAKATINKIKDIAPCYYVPGNHEAWIDASYQVLLACLKKANINIVTGKVIELEKNREKIQLAGVKDPDFETKDGNKALQNEIMNKELDELPLKDEYSILLSHRPELFTEYVNHNINLVLTGHTHGGQGRIPFIGGLIAPNQGYFPKYDAGKFQKKDTTMIISRGIGNSVVPVRVNDRPELVIVELNKT